MLDLLVVTANELFIYTVYCSKFYLDACNMPSANADFSALVRCLGHPVNTSDKGRKDYFFSAVVLGGICMCADARAVHKTTSTYYLLTWFFLGHFGHPHSGTHKDINVTKFL